MNFVSQVYQQDYIGECSGTDYSGYTELYYPTDGAIIQDQRPYSSSSSCSSHEEHHYIPAPYASVIVDSNGLVNQFVH